MRDRRMNCGPSFVFAAPANGITPFLHRRHGDATASDYGHWARTLFVTSNAAFGPGTFSAAIDIANADARVRRIQFIRVGRVQLQSRPPTMRVDLEPSNHRVRVTRRSVM
jgi:hypothetical protein